MLGSRIRRVARWSGSDGPHRLDAGAGTSSGLSTRTTSSNHVDSLVRRPLEQPPDHGRPRASRVGARSGSAAVGRPGFTSCWNFSGFRVGAIATVQRRTQGLVAVELPLVEVMYGQHVRDQVRPAGARAADSAASGEAAASPRTTNSASVSSRRSVGSRSPTRPGSRPEPRLRRQPLPQGRRVPQRPEARAPRPARPADRRRSMDRDWRRLDAASSSSPRMQSRAKSHRSAVAPARPRKPNPRVVVRSRAASAPARSRATTPGRAEWWTAAPCRVSSSSSQELRLQPRQLVGVLVEVAEHEVLVEPLPHEVDLRRPTGDRGPPHPAGSGAGRRGGGGSRPRAAAAAPGRGSRACR